MRTKYAQQSGGGMSSSHDPDAASVEAARMNVRVDLSDEFQAEIREFARVLPGLDYFQILGIARGAAPEEVRDAFFERSKTFHPDRYFKKELGPYAALLTEVYKRIVAAHDVLRDVKLSASYQKTLPDSNAGAAPRSPVTRAKTAAKPATPAPAPVARGSSLRNRLGLQSPGLVLDSLQKQLEQSRARARKHFEAALQQKATGYWARAAQLVELAIAFDPREKQYHDELADLLPRANSERAADVRRKAEMLLHGDRAGAAELLEEAAQLCPTDAELAHKLSNLLFEIGSDLAKAGLYGERAVALDEDELRFRKSLAAVYRRAGQPQKARKHLQRAWELDPLDKEIRLALQTL
jgi:tetratricopeptide (TPR) repeat protein